VTGELDPAAAGGTENGSQLTARYTPLEAVLGEYGFYWIRDEVRRRRLAALPFASEDVQLPRNERKAPRDITSE